MNSPPDPGSPSALSTPSSASPPPEEVNFHQTSAQFINNLASQVTSAFTGGNSSKRRLPGGSSFGAASSARDPKSRRRGDSGRNNWEGGKEGGAGRKEKDELIDTNVVDWLRKGALLSIAPPVQLTYYPSQKLAIHSRNTLYTNEQWWFRLVCQSPAYILVCSLSTTALHFLACNNITCIIDQFWDYLFRFIGLHRSTNHSVHTNL